MSFKVLKLISNHVIYQIGFGTSKMMGPKNKIFGQESRYSKGLRKSAKIVLSKSIFDDKNRWIFCFLLEDIFFVKNIIY